MSHSGNSARREQVKVQSVSRAGFTNDTATPAALLSGWPGLEKIGTTLLTWRSHGSTHIAILRRSRKEALLRPLESACLYLSPVYGGC